MAAYIFLSPEAATGATAASSFLESSFPPKRPPPREIPKRGSPTPREKEVEADDDDTDAKTEKATRRVVKKQFMVVYSRYDILVEFM